MIKNTILPIGMGAAMGVMMLWMVHMPLTGARTMGFGALAVFVGAHIAGLAVLRALHSGGA